MTKDEFCNHVTKVFKENSADGTAAGMPIPSDADYKVIEYIYAFHPSISETEGKRQIAELYVKFGMALIRDLMPRAQLMEQKEKELRETRTRLEKLQREIGDLRKGHECAD